MSENDDAQERFSVARMYDYLLGGSNNFAIDRSGAHALLDVMPDLAELAWANRGFHQRAARWMAHRAGIRQFLDIGSGLPTQSNTHHVVQKIDPATRTGYVDNDPAVFDHAPGLLDSVGNTVFVPGDVRRPDEILSNPKLRELLDFDRPIGLLMTAVLHFVAYEDDPATLVTNLMNGLAPGSYVAISHGTADRLSEQRVEKLEDLYRRRSNSPIYPRTKSQVESFFEGLRLVEPYAGTGPVVTYVGLWGAEDPHAADDDPSRLMYCGVARKLGPDDDPASTEQAVLD